ncbi:hypothetical protein [Gordonia hydrophobica]|uniref:Fido domain-containing protein n=1 Tax=Gordonia hydrophobica TaxID=40516 RepID=A0ABZ2U4Q2_9ACTN|nr:hypothetical protein [Gordonia hydrophobica]MBM7368274.1 fido (protein-threonine AMPylation protein) [Gordonia hydrophobica]
MTEPESTRTFDTLQGEVTYDRLNDLIADPYRVTLDEVLDGSFDDQPLSVDLLRELHRRFVEPVMPGLAGVWRSERVAVGYHEPPHVHPFKDFNGRTVRLFCWFVAVRHFKLPVGHTWVEAGTPEDTAYRAALREFDDHRNPIPMKDFWIANRLQ